MNGMQVTTLNRLVVHNKNIYTDEFISTIMTQVANVESYEYDKSTYSLSIKFNKITSRGNVINIFKELLAKSLPAEYIQDEPFMTDGLFFNVLLTSNYSSIIYL